MYNTDSAGVDDHASSTASATSSLLGETGLTPDTVTCSRKIRLANNFIAGAEALLQIYQIIR